MRAEILAKVLKKSAIDGMMSNQIKYYLANDFAEVIATYCERGKTVLYFCKCSACVDVMVQLTNNVKEQYELKETSI
jgi:hypothetical protein